MMASNKERIHTVLGTEFGDNACKSAIIVRVVYGLKSVNVSFRAHLAKFMWKLGYKSCNAYSDLWMKPEFWPDDKLKY